MTSRITENTADSRVEAGEEKRKSLLSSSLRTYIFVAEIVFVISLFVWWFSSDTAQTSRSLWVLFFYCFPAEFILAAVPHEPVLLFFAKFYPPIIIALVSATGTLLAEALNYTAFNYVTDLRGFKKIREGRAVQKTVNLFHRAPFAALWVAGLTPIPFYPFRFLVVLARYPLWKYLLAVLVSRTPRFYLIAFFGRLLKIPDYLLAGLFIILILAANIPLLGRLLRKKQVNVASLETRDENNSGGQSEGKSEAENQSR